MFDKGASLKTSICWPMDVYPLGQQLRAVVGLMDRALDLKPEVTQGCGFESRLRQEVHDCSPGAAQSACPLFQVCTLGWVKCKEHISLLIILCIIVYVTNKAHPSLICMLMFSHGHSATSWQQVWHI